MKKVAITAAIILTGLLFAQFIRLSRVAINDADTRFAQKANLALRRTAHILLTEAGDTTSRIAPVQQSNTTFLIRLEHPFNYNRLPALLQESLTLYAIRASYDVAVLDCARGELQLGYSVRDLIGQPGVPCSGRQQKQGCYTVQITFSEPANPAPSTTFWLAVGLGLLVTGGAYVAWQRANPTRLFHASEVPEDNKPGNLIQLGQSWFDRANQSVAVAGILHPLTYREAKLLQFFMDHPNQVVERDLILKSVWEDEGVIVGRSVDVFVSRLRKLLQADSTLRIVAVHGVGYRLDVQRTPQAA